MTTIMFILEIVGTVAFAVSGAITGLRKNMDIFGISILGLTTAVGGGILRDVILGITPPKTFQHPVYAITAISTSFLIFFLAIIRRLPYNHKWFDGVLSAMDSIGLGAFTISGICVAMESSSDYSIFLTVFVGVATGVGGGLMRDVMAGNTPYIFIKHVYACAALAGAIVCVLMWESVGGSAAMICGMVTIILLRFLSRHFKWNLPRANYADIN